MKNSVSVLLSAALLTVGLVACPSEKTVVTPPVDAVTTELILNGGFEASTTDWTFTGDARRSTFPTACAKNGAAYGRIEKIKAFSNGLSQTFNVPNQGTTMLKYWVRIESKVSQASADDSLVVRVNGTVINTLTTANPQEVYAEYSYDLSELVGKSVTIEFKGTFKDLEETNFCIDDVSALNSK